MPKLVARLTQDICIRMEQAGYAKNVPQLYLEFEKRIREVRVRNGKNSLKSFICLSKSDMWSNYSNTIVFVFETQDQSICICI